MIVFGLKHQPEPKQYRLTDIHRDVFLAALLASGAQVQRVEFNQWLIYGGMSYSTPYMVRAESDAPMSGWQRGYNEDYSESGDITEVDAMEILLEDHRQVKPVFEAIALSILVTPIQED